jgi:hypothetical protein
MSRAMGEARAHIERLARPVHEIIDNDGHHARESLSAVFDVLRRRYPPIFGADFKRFPELGRVLDLSVFVNDAPFLADFLQGRNFRRGELDGLVDQHVKGCFVEFAVTLELAKFPVADLIL